MSEPENFGTTLERRRRLKYWILMAAALVGAFVIGLAERSLADPAGSLSPILAIMLCAAFAALLIVGNWLYHRSVDELEWANNLIACFWGFNAFVLIWPVWMILQRGGLAPPPDILTIYGGAVATAIVVYVWKKFR